MGSVVLSFFDVDIEDSYEFGWLLIYVFTVPTVEFVGYDVLIFCSHPNKNKI